MTHSRLKNNLRGDLEGFLAILFSNTKFRNKVTKVKKRKGVLMMEGELYLEDT